MLNYRRPDWFTKNIFNPAVAGLTKLGLPLAGSRVLAVRGRKSGEWRTTPVNPLALDGQRYLVAPRGHTQWVRNMRIAGGGELRLARRTEKFVAQEVPDSEKVPILRGYLKHWKWEAGMFFDGKGPDSSDAELQAIAPDHPVFRISPPPAA